MPPPLHVLRKRKPGTTISELHALGSDDSSLRARIDAACASRPHVGEASGWVSRESYVPAGPVTVEDSALDAALGAGTRVLG